VGLRAPHLHRSLRGFCLGAFRVLCGELDSGTDLPFAFEEHASFGRPALYEYRPLVRSFIEARASALAQREDARLAVDDLSREPAARIFARAHAGERANEEGALFRTVVLPLLQKYGFTGVFFVTVNLVGRDGYLTRDQVRALADAGMDVESHAMDHVSMKIRTLADQRYQMCTARQFLSQWTGTDVRHFAYPSGDYNADSFSALQSCGYLSAYKKMGGSLQSSANMDLLQRARVVGQLGLPALLTALQQ
jgi:hypothetical protein